MAITKSDLADQMASAAGIKRQEATVALEACLAAITNALVERDTVRILGFGTFSTADRDARTARVPGTGAEVQVAACTVPKFKAGKQLKDAVNNKEPVKV